MAREPRLPSESRVADLLATYRQAQRTIIAQIKAAAADSDVRAAARRRGQLASVLRTLQDLGVETDPLARQIVAGVFTESSDRILVTLNKLGVTGLPDTGFSGVSMEAIQVLEDSILGRLQSARDVIGRQVADVFATQQRRSALLSMLGAEGSPRKASTQLQDALRKQGKTAFIDKAGRRWALEDYANMATRTVVREAATQGAIVRMAAHGVSLARVSTHASSCAICKPWEGHLLSLDGATTEYQGEAVADGPFPPYHPNCKHSLSPFVPAVEELRREIAGR